MTNEREKMIDTWDAVETAISMGKVQHGTWKAQASQVKRRISTWAESDESNRNQASKELWETEPLPKFESK